MGGVCRQTASINRGNSRSGQIPQAKTRFEPVHDIPPRHNCAQNNRTQDSRARDNCAKNTPVHDNCNSSPSPQRNTGIFSFLPDLNLDDDKIIIILLIAVLAKNGADIKLLIALGYLLMD